MSLKLEPEITKICDTICELHLKENQLKIDIESIEEKKSLKQSLFVSIETYYDLCKKYFKAKQTLESKSQAHFKELRCRLDMQRVKLKEKIDQSYSHMIEQTERVEAVFSTSLIQHLETIDATLTSNIRKTFWHQEQFRETNHDSNILKEQQDFQIEAISQIQTHLNVLSQIEVNLSVKNEFIPNNSFSMDSFGKLSLYNQPLFELKNSSRITDNFYQSLIQIKNEKVESGR
jgi:hypothetical protein